MMPARLIPSCALLFALYFWQTHVAADDPDAGTTVPAITWMQVTSENQFSLPAGHRFIPLSVIRWSISSNNRMRIEEGDRVYISDRQSGEALAIDLQKKTARRNREDRKADLYQKMHQSVFERGVEIKGRGTIVGRDATIYSWPDNPDSLGWCDTETGETLYCEAQHPITDRQKGISSVSFNYNYNARLNRNLFSLEPPPGFKLVE